MVTNCVFCAVLHGDEAAEWVWRGPAASALLPLSQGRLAPGHTLVISNEHAVGVHDVSPDGLIDVMLLVQCLARQMVPALGAVGVNVLNASGPGSDQSVDHLHFHLVPRWPNDGLDTWVHGRSSHEAGDGWLARLRDRMAANVPESR